MDAIIIEGDAENNRILAKLAKKIGNRVISLNDEEYEDLAFGKMMTDSKTGEDVSRVEIMKKLKK